MASKAKKEPPGPAKGFWADARDVANRYSSTQQPVKHPGRGPNKISRDLKEGIVDAAIAHGMDGKGTRGLAGYLFMLARDYPKQYAPLLARLMPLQINATRTNFIGAVHVVSVPNDRFLTSEQIRELNPLPEPVVIDGELVDDDEAESGAA